MIVVLGEASSHLSNSPTPGQSDYVPNSSVMIFIAARFQCLPRRAVPFAAASCTTQKSSSKTANVMTKTMITSSWKALDFSIALFAVEGFCIWFQSDQNCLFVFVTCSLFLQNPFQLAWDVHCIYSWVSYSASLREPWKLLLPVWWPPGTSHSLPVSRHKVTQWRGRHGLQLQSPLGTQSQAKTLGLA